MLLWEKEKRKTSFVFVFLIHRKKENKQHNHATCNATIAYAKTCASQLIKACSRVVENRSSPNESNCNDRLSPDMLTGHRHRSRNHLHNLQAMISFVLEKKKPRIDVDTLIIAVVQWEYSDASNTLPSHSSWNAGNRVAPTVRMCAQRRACACLTCARGRGEPLAFFNFQLSLYGASPEALLVESFLVCCRTLTSSL